MSKPRKTACRCCGSLFFRAHLCRNDRVRLAKQALALVVGCACGRHPRDPRFDPQQRQMAREALS
jgi:hypothetical protein